MQKYPYVKSIFKYDRLIPHTNKIFYYSIDFKWKKLNGKYTEKYIY